MSEATPAGTDAQHEIISLLRQNIEAMQALQGMLRNSNPPGERLLSIAEICEAKGIAKLSKFYEMRRSGDFPLSPVRVGGSIRFRQSEVDRWIELGCPSANRWNALQSRRAG